MHKYKNCRSIQMVAHSVLIHQVASRKASISESEAAIPHHHLRFSPSTFSNTPELAGFHPYEPEIVRWMLVQ
jgi:uncharacterized protein with WD repeat